MSIPDAATRPPQGLRARGLSLIELLMFMVIISVALVAILTVQVQSSRVSADPQMRKQALAIAEGLLEEISLARFTFCDPSDPNADSVTSASLCTTPEVAGPESGNTRPFDNVNDYVDAFGTAKSYSSDAAGAVYPSGYAAKVTITPETGLGPAGSPITPADATPANMNVLRISVEVSYRNASEKVILDGYRTRYAPNSVP